MYARGRYGRTEDRAREVAQQWADVALEWETFVGAEYVIWRIAIAALI